MYAHGSLAESTRTDVNGRTSTARVRRRRASPRAPRARVAAAASILCFAAMHVLVRLVDGGLHRDAGFLNVFTMLEVQRLWPAVAAGPAAACASLVFALAVYGIVYATMTRPLHVVVARRVTAHPTSEAEPGRNGVAAYPRSLSVCRLPAPDRTR